MLFPPRLTALVATALAALAASSAPAGAQTLGPDFSGYYSVFDLGSASGLAAPYGGLTLEAGDPNTLLIGGSANNGGGVIDAVGLTRDAGGHITGFTGPATLFAAAPNIDGGLAYGPGGVLFYTAYPTNQVGEIKPGSTAPDKVVDLTGVGSSVGSLGFVPAGFAGAGGFRLISYNGGEFYGASLTPDGSGTFDIGPGTFLTAPNRGPEGFVYVPTGSPAFGLSPSMLISEYGTGTVGAYGLDANGNPDPATRRDFLTGLSGAEGAFIDPQTGDFLFSTFGGNHVIEVRGFAAVPEPAGLALLAGGGAILLGVARRRRRRAPTAA